MSTNLLCGLGSGFRQAMENPFGIDFVMQGTRIYIPFGSAINCLGYNDFLERIIGVTRVGFALIALAVNDDKKDRLIASGHLFRGVLEMMGSFELCLLVLDIAFTIYNLICKVFVKTQPEAAYTD